MQPLLGLLLVGLAVGLMVIAVLLPSYPVINRRLLHRALITAILLAAVLLLVKCGLHQ